MIQLQISRDAFLYTLSFWLYQNPDAGTGDNTYGILLRSRAASPASISEVSRMILESRLVTVTGCIKGAHDHCQMFVN